jgi:plasmid stabilization system protein ParE
MTYRVDISPSALKDAEEVYLWMREQSPSRANAWFVGLIDAIFSLENFPARCPLAPESENIGKEIRQLLYGKRGQIYRIIFGIVRDEATGEEIVRVYRVWHGARDRLQAGDIEEEENERET